MFISFIIISENELGISENVKRLKAVLNDSLSFEIVGAFGKNPSRQRNEAAKHAKGEWLYFLDDDSLFSDFNIDELKLVLKKYPKAIVVGGPSVLHHNESVWQKAIELVFTTDLGVGPLKARYLSVGQTRLSNEKELILCNLVIQKTTFIEANGFNEELYPNEENEFLSRLKKLGEIVYAPQMVVYRKHRENIFLFFKQMIRYGQGRTRHLLFSTEYGDFVYFIPLCGLIAVGVFLFLEPMLFGWVLALYSVIILPTLIINAIYGKSLLLIIFGYLAYSVCHLGYALGLFLGLLDLKKRSSTNPTVKILN